MSFYKVHISGDYPMVVESINHQNAANVYARINGVHPYTMYCTCCGIIGSCYEMDEKQVLEEMEDGTMFVFSNEYDNDDLVRGSMLQCGNVLN